MKIFLYCLKIWLISVVTGTLLFYFIGKPTDDSSLTFWGYMGIICLGATLFSLPSFFLFWLGVWFLTGRPISLRRRRVQTMVWATILVIAPFPIMVGSNSPNWFLLAELCGCYWLPLIVGIGFFRFPTLTQANSNSNQ